MSKGIGELVVVALKAVSIIPVGSSICFMNILLTLVIQRNLPNRAIIGKQDPLCRFILGKHSQITKADIRGGQHPVWDDQVNLPVDYGINKLRFRLYDGSISKDILISDGELDITKLMKEGEQDGWFPLQYKGRSAGDIYLELTFYSSAKPRVTKKLPQEPPEPQQRRNKPLPRPPPEQQLMYRHSINIPPNHQNSGMRPPPISTGGSGYAGPASAGYPPSVSAYPPAQQQQRPSAGHQQYQTPSTMYPPVGSSNLPPAGFIDPSTRPPPMGNPQGYGGFPTPVVTPRIPQQSAPYSAYPPVQQSPMYQSTMLQQPYDPQQQQQQQSYQQGYESPGGYSSRPVRQNTLSMHDPSHGYPPASGYPPSSGYPPASGYPPSSGYPPASGYPPSAGYPPSNGYPPY